MARVPRRLSDNPSALGSLTADDKHLLSFVDSTLDEQDLAFVTGKALPQVTADLERFAQLGLVEFSSRERSSHPAEAGFGAGRAPSDRAREHRSSRPSGQSPRPRSSRPSDRTGSRADAGYGSDRADREGSAHPSDRSTSRRPTERPSHSGETLRRADRPTPRVEAGHGGRDPRAGKAGGAGAAKADVPEEEIELSAEDKQAILELHARLADLDDAEILAVDPAAGTGEIRKAYNKLARRFHPDRHFRKKLGHYKQKIEEIFVRLTAAHDNLRAGRRAQGKAEPPSKDAPAAEPARASPAAAPAAAPPVATRIVERAIPLEPPQSAARVALAPSTAAEANSLRRPTRDEPAPTAPAVAANSLRRPTRDEPAPTAQAGAKSLRPPARAEPAPAPPPAWPLRSTLDGKQAPPAPGPPNPTMPSGRPPVPAPGPPKPTTPSGRPPVPAPGPPKPTTPSGRPPVPVPEPPKPTSHDGRQPAPAAAPGPPKPTSHDGRQPAPAIAPGPPKPTTLDGRSPLQSAPEKRVVAPAAGAATPDASIHAAAPPQLDPERARRAMAEALARRLGGRPHPPTPSARRGPEAGQAAPAAGGEDPEQPPAPAHYDAGPNVARSTAEIFRARFDVIETQARLKRSHQFLAEAMAAFSRGDFKAAAEAYRSASELNPEDAALARKVEDVAKLARRMRR